MGTINIIRSSFLKEVRSSVRSVLFIGVVVSVAALSIIASYEELLDPFTPRLPQYFTAFVLQGLFAYFFLIFLIMPAVSISEENEKGLWDMIRIYKKGRINSLLGRFAAQVFMAAILIITSVAFIEMTYLVFNGGFTTQVSVAVLRHPDSSPTTGLFYFEGIKYFSPLDIYVEIGLSIAVSVVIVLMGLLISIFSPRRLVSIMLLVSIFVILSSVSSDIASAFGPMKTLYRAIAVIDPPYLFGITGKLLNLYAYMPATGSRPGGMLLQSQIHTPVNTVISLLNIRDYIIEIISLISVELTVYLVYGRLRR